MLILCFDQINALSPVHISDNVVFIYLFIITPDGSQTYSYTNTTQLYKKIKNIKQHRNNMT